jgi:hypothetical protein
MVLAEHLADDRRGLARPRAGGEPQVLPHRIEDAALNGLQPVADVGQRARRDDGQRVAEIPLLRRLPEICFERCCCGHRPPPHHRKIGGILAIAAANASRRGRFRTTFAERARLHEIGAVRARFFPHRDGTGVALFDPVQNGDAPRVTVLLLDADRRGSSSLASGSPSLAVTVDVPEWQARIAVLSTTRAREGDVRVGAISAPHGARREDRFVPLAAVVPTAHASH